MCDENNLRSGIWRIGFSTMTLYLFILLYPEYLAKNKSVVILHPPH
jgi:hypothetical protein